MAIELLLYRLPGVTSVTDLSGTTGTTSGYQSSAQYLFAKWTGDSLIAPCAALTDQPAGVIQTNPKWATGNPAVGVEIGTLGYSKVVANETLVAGDLVGPAANGRAAKRAVASGGGDANRWVSGVVVEGGAITELVTVNLFTPFFLQA